MRVDRPTVRSVAIAAITLLPSLTLVSSSHATTPAAHASRTYFAQHLNGDAPAYRPKSLSPQPTATLFVRHMTWGSWTATRAKGKGIVLANDCNPDCASGRYRHDPAKVTLHHPHMACGKDFFDKMELHYTAKNFPSSVNRHQTYIVQPDMCGTQPAIVRVAGTTTGSRPPPVRSGSGTPTVKPANG